jgi:hypothetical protein
MCIDSIFQCLCRTNVYFDSSDSESEAEESPGDLWKSPIPTPITPPPLSLDMSSPNSLGPKIQCVGHIISLEESSATVRISSISKKTEVAAIQYEVFAGINKLPCVDGGAVQGLFVKALDREAE